jgi:hypothetical protein
MGQKRAENRGLWGQVFGPFLEKYVFITNETPQEVCSRIRTILSIDNFFPRNDKGGPLQNRNFGFTVTRVTV